MEPFSALLAICAGNSPIPVNSPHKGQWRGALMFSMICVWINGWVNNRGAGDLRRYRAHYDVTVMWGVFVSSNFKTKLYFLLCHIMFNDLLYSTAVNHESLWHCISHSATFNFPPYFFISKHTHSLDSVELFSYQEIQLFEISELLSKHEYVTDKAMVFFLEKIWISRQARAEESGRLLQMIAITVSGLQKKKIFHNDIPLCNFVLVLFILVNTIWDCMGNVFQRAITNNVSF